MPSLSGIGGGSYLVGIFCRYTVCSDSAIRALKQQVQSETVILEDHLSRSLDVVTARLRFVAAFANVQSLKDERLRAGTDFMS